MLTVVASESDTQTVLPSGLTAILHGPLPTLIGASAVGGFDVKFMGVTELESKFVTYAVAPDAVIAMATGPRPTLIDVSSEGGDDFKLIGVTELPLEFVTYAVRALGEIAMPSGPFIPGEEPRITARCWLDDVIAVTELMLRFVTYTVPDVVAVDAAPAVERLAHSDAAGPTSPTTMSVRSARTLRWRLDVAVIDPMSWLTQFAFSEATTRRLAARPLAVALVDTRTTEYPGTTLILTLVSFMVAKSISNWVATACARFKSSVALKAGVNTLSV